MRCFEGIGDTLEDDVEHMHQISARIEARVSRMKDKDKQALLHSKMEAIQFNVEVSETIELSKQLAKRSFKNQNPELCAATRAVSRFNRLALFSSITLKAWRLKTCTFRVLEANWESAIIM
jgi:hypothetical protein